ncbi:hypothetical protein C922_01452 [Plasmodium inui San Antonio 1]|uniref:SURF1-like protein n=1 Tax=Plasmodium inui San Antonio 1 TaxID=1237626 RepID=W7AHB7_9APIC|nr:hypothetical protein C922_01452 [Plasmodium inui San Antonio 1]EUD68429.1 hypothetical protein C922_01452 [Plasmodium inui San Antonio 1]
MPFLNNALNVKGLILKLNSTLFMRTRGVCELHIECVRPAFFESRHVRITCANRLFRKERRKKLSPFWRSGKYRYVVKGKKVHNVTSRKRISPFGGRSRNKFPLYEVEIDLLNEELKSVEKKINEKRIVTNEDKEISIAHFKYPSQKLYKANEEEINLIKRSEGQYYLPLECENSTIIRLIDIKNKVSSPIFRCVRNSKFGLRKNERLFFFFYSSFICSFCFFMGVWQYKKMGKKKFLIDYIMHNLSQPVINITDSGFPWFDDFLAVKKNYEILQRHEREGDLLRNFNLLNIVPMALSFYKRIKGHPDELFTEGSKSICCNKSTEDIPKKDEQEKDLQPLKCDFAHEEGNRLIVDLENAHSVHHWVSRIRNENFVTQFCRKVFPKGVTEEELKKLIIEKYKYRKVQLTGVLDTTNEFFVGPKMYEYDKKKKYYYVICPIFLKNGKCILVNRGLISEDMLEEKQKEIPKVVTIRGVLDPGELYECSFRKLKILSNKNVYSNYLYYYDIAEICHYANVAHFEGSSFFIANIYDIIVHEDYNSDLIKDHYSNCGKEGTKLLNSHLNKVNGITLDDMDRESQERIKRLLKKGPSCGGGTNDKKETSMSPRNGKPFRYDEHLIHKRKREYFKFYADETTHFNYACQWFLFSFVFSTISMFKFLQFKKWVF